MNNREKVHRIRSEDSRLRLHRTVNGVTTSYALLGTVTLQRGGKVEKVDTRIEPKAWKFSGVAAPTEISLAALYLNPLVDHVAPTCPRRQPPARTPSHHERATAALCPSAMIARRRNSSAWDRVTGRPSGQWPNR
jgi:hypothetical protein